ncbi:MAG: type II secretion system protein [bacterium]|nr:type II secretion system protein [bacterium]
MRKGFTLPELVIVIAVMLVLIALVTTNLLRPQHRASTTSAMVTLIGDLKQQQLKAMLGNTEGGTTAGSFGVFIDNGQYVLFHGSTYAANDTTNFAVVLDTPLAISTSLLNSQLVFAPGSGEVVGWQTGSDTISLTHSESKETSTLTINAYGTVAQIN